MSREKRSAKPNSLEALTKIIVKPEAVEDWYVFNRGQFIERISYCGDSAREALESYYHRKTFPKGVEASRLNKQELLKIMNEVNNAAISTINSVVKLVESLGYKQTWHIRDTSDNELFIFRPPNGEEFSGKHEKKLVSLMTKLGFRKDYDTPRGDRSGPCGWSYGEDTNSSNLAIWRGDM